MNALKPEQFEDFFRELYAFAPFGWQTRLARMACEGNWPRIIKLPTGAGKTACLDIATFALAYQAGLPPAERTAPMRMFFVVDRRIVVSEAFRRASGMRNALLRSSEDRPTVRIVAERLQHLAGEDAAPLDVVELRGGIYRDPRWARSLTQPTIITSTVDQVGSRLLFRGYGVSDSARPIHAALTAYDSLIILDEAHCSRAFSQTLTEVRRFQGAPWAAQPIQLPLVTVEMTATPPTDVSEGAVFALTNEELNDRESRLWARRHTPKPARLVVADKAKGARVLARLAEQLVDEAAQMVAEDRRAIAIVVNRVATAKRAYNILREKHPESTVELMIGRMRPIDREDQARRLHAAISSGTDESHRPQAPLFVVATQCIEVGADLDFDGLVTETASLDALRQRFGRLNRTAREVRASASIIIRADQLKTDEQLAKLAEADRVDDPIYDNALGWTWNWLNELASRDAKQQVDFGIAAMDRAVEQLMESNRDLWERLQIRSPDAPTLLPSHLDLLCQTSDAPCHDPDVSLWLHGPQHNEPEVQVCWRADLTVPPTSDDSQAEGATSEREESKEPDSREKFFAQAVSLCPPSSSECISVSLSRVKAWLTHQEITDDNDADVPALSKPEIEPRKYIPLNRQPLAWRGIQKSQLLSNSNEVRPGDTLVLPVTAGGWSEWGFIPDSPPDPAVEKLEFDEETRRRLAQVDVADRAYRQSRRRAIVRLHRQLMLDWPSDSDAINTLRGLAYDPNTRWNINDELRKFFASAADDLEQASTSSDAATSRRLREISDSLRKLSEKDVSVVLERYTADAGAVIRSRRVLQGDEALQPFDDGEDTASQIRRDGPVELGEHLRHVADRVRRSLACLPLESWGNVLVAAAEMHDWGKADPRFQALLLASDLTTAWFQPKLWAKSASIPVSREERRIARERAGLPTGFRHEMLSSQLSQNSKALPTSDPDMCLLLHLVDGHHGYARPLAPISIDPDPPDVNLELIHKDAAISSEQRRNHPSHDVGSGVAERFWKVTRRYGWWGAAFLETVLRLADQLASEREEFEEVLQ